MLRLALALLLCSVIISVSCKKTKPHVCAYDINNSPYGFGACYVNPAWITSITTYSPIAKIEAKQSAQSVACAKHDVSSGSESALSKCYHDEANHCYPYRGTLTSPWSCLSNAQPAFAESGILCPGTVYTNDVICSGYNVSDCGKHSECKLIPNLPSAAVYNQTQADSFGYANKYICREASADGSSQEALNNWANINLQPTTYEGVIKSRGSCPYGLAAAKRISIIGTCYDINRNGPTSGAPYIMGMASDGTDMYNEELGYYIPVNITSLNQTLVNQCLATDGCRIYNDVGYPLDTFDVPGQSPTVVCYADYADYISLKYPDERDWKIVVAWQTCQKNQLQWNKTACVAAKPPGI